MGPKEAYVGTEYEKGGSFPRLLFISLDSGFGYPNPAERTWHAVRRQNLGCLVPQLHKGGHWYRTLDLAYRIMNLFLPGKVQVIQDILPYFSHINSAKCCMNNPGNHNQADKILFQNCKDYIADQVEILSPDIIITQGIDAWSSISERYRISAKVDRINCDKGISLDYYQISLKNKSTLWFFTYNPVTANYNKRNYPCLDNIALTAHSLLNGIF